MSFTTNMTPLIAGASALLALWEPAVAQTFPDRPIHVIVPFAPGGPVDVLARALGEGFRERMRILGSLVPTVLENAYE